MTSHRVHRALIRQPTLFGVERPYFFPLAFAIFPIFIYGGFSLLAFSWLLVVFGGGYTVAACLTRADCGLLFLWLDSLRYDDYYAATTDPRTARRRTQRRGLRL